MSRKHYWIGYSSLQLALGLCFFRQYFSDEKSVSIIRKTNRYPYRELDGIEIKEYNPWLAFLMLANLFFSGSVLWIPGISPSSCSFVEKKTLKILFRLGKLRFYDDGLAGFIPNTYTWYYTSYFIPQALGDVTWNQPVRSQLFQSAVEVDVTGLKRIEHGLKVATYTSQSALSLFIEANAMNISKLYQKFSESISDCSPGLYFAHTDKGSVSSQFEYLEARAGLSVGSSPFQVFYSHKYKMLESFVLSLLDRYEHISIFSGCTSTVLIILLYSCLRDSQERLRIFYSPDYTGLHPEKISQAEAFYAYIEKVYPEQCTKLNS
jgi:hypothetical protein